MEVTAFAPATVANVFVGFDILGFALDNLGDQVTVKLTEDTTHISSISGMTEIPTAIDENTAGKAIQHLLQTYNPDLSLEIEIVKGIPLSSGLGGSAASAVAAVVAANGCLDDPLPISQLLESALVGEQVASGSIHADNTAACLYGGLVASLQSEDESFEIVELPIPNGLELVIIHPDIEVKTKDARGIISPTITLQDHIHQNMDLIRFIAACYRNDIVEFGKSLRDNIIEPQRSHLIPKFAELKELALASNALGFTISGAGPTVLACFDSQSVAIDFESHIPDIDLPYTYTTWQTGISTQGASITRRSD